MSFDVFFVPSHLLETVALALSIFNLVAFLWLAFTVWLNGDRRSSIARVGVVGLGLSALFFFIHALLIASPLSATVGLVTADFLWRLIWLPALGVPYIWFVIGLHYASLINEQWRRRRPLLLVCGALFGGIVFLSLLLNRAAFTFEGAVYLLAYGLAVYQAEMSMFSSFAFPVLFLCYVTFCAIAPWFTPGRVWRLIKTLFHACLGRKGNHSFRRRLADAFWDDPTDFERLEEPVLSWHLARPVLLFAALLMVALVTCLGFLSVRSILNRLRLRDVISPPSVSHPAPLDLLPPNLIMLDIFTTGLVAVIMLLFGYSIVRHGILIERPLARRAFFEQWRGIVIVASAVALFIALFVALTRSNLGGLLLITVLATAAYALFTWSSYTAHDRYITMLRPFLRSTNLRHWLNIDLQKTEQGMEDLFFHLCKDVLDVQCARLMVLEGSVSRVFDYRWSICDEIDEVEEQTRSGKHEYTLLPAIHHMQPYKSSFYPEGSRAQAYRVRMRLQGGLPTICWILPIYDELGLVAKLYLGPRRDGAIFSSEDMDLAHACGQRILDTLRDHEAMLAVAGLLRRRIVDVKLLGAQQRRVLHDEILPHMHLALLKLETLRPSINGTQEHITSELSEQANVALNETVAMISEAHRRLAAMMRATATSAPHRLERDGIMRAIRTMIEQDFQQAFDEVKWEVSDETARYIDDIIPPAIAELIFAAVQEALRNAARHGRGSDVHRRLCLLLRASCNPHLEVVVADDGIGIVSASSSTTGTGGGLLTHSALLAIAGGSLTVNSPPGKGVTVRILLPAEALR